MEITLGGDNFTEQVLKSDLPVLVDFWAEWCGPCHAIAPALTQIANEFEGKLKVGKLNVDQNQELAMTYQVRSIPNLKIFVNGKIADELVGVMPKEEIVKRLQKHLT